MSRSLKEVRAEPCRYQGQNNPGRGEAGVKPQDGVSGAMTMGEAMCGEQRDRGQICWPLDPSQGSGFCSEKCGASRDFSRGDVAWLRLTSVCRSRGRSIKAGFMGSPRPEMSKSHTLHQGGCEKWSGSGCILKVDPTGFPGGPDIGCERKGEFGLCGWKDGVARNGDGDSCGRSRFGVQRLGGELWTCQVRSIVDVTRRLRVGLGSGRVGVQMSHLLWVGSGPKATFPVSHTLDRSGLNCQVTVTSSQEIMHALKMTWHVHCFTCTACKTPIRNRAFYMEEGAPYCDQGKK